MKKTNTYTQVKLVRTIGKTLTQEHTCWIPTIFAKKDAIVSFTDDARIPLGKGWKVHSVYNTEKAEYIEEHERDYLKQREASDI